MKQYLKTIHERSPAHKKRFALTVSGIITLTIFGIWSFVVFGNKNLILAENQNSNVTVVSNTAVDNSKVTSPFDDISSGIAGVFEAIKNQFGQVKQTVNSIDVSNKYDEVRNQALTN